VLRLRDAVWGLVVRRLYEITPAGHPPELAREDSRTSILMQV
jgi:hypothetical protein